MGHNSNGGHSTARSVAIVILVIMALGCIVLAIALMLQPTGQSGVISTTSTVGSKQGNQSTEKSAQIIYDGPDMKVTYGGLEDVSVSGVAILSLTVENKTSQDVDIIANPLSMNGCTIDALGGAQCQAGHNAIAQWTLSFKQANVSNFSDIKSVSMNIEFVVLGSTVDVVASAPISLEF